VLKNSLLVLSIIILLGMWVIATVEAVQIFYDLAQLQVEHDLMLTYNEP
jgi:hypothetical protein